MFRQVVLSTTKSKIPAPYTAMVHREGIGGGGGGGQGCVGYVDETETLFQRDSWKTRKSLSRSISLEHIKDDNSPEKLAAKSSLKRLRAQSAKVSTSKDRVLRNHDPRAEVPRIVPVVHVDDPQEEKITESSVEVKEKLKGLARAFTHRGHSVKSQISRNLSPPPSTTPEVPERLRLDSMMIHQEDWMKRDEAKGRKSALKELWQKLRAGEVGVFDPQSYLYISWLFVVGLCFVYNAWAIFLRSIFPYQTPENLSTFMALDYMCDGIYLLDMLIFKSRVRFIKEGQLIEDPSLTRREYMRRSVFKLDVLALLPLDLFYLKYGPNPLFRFPRLFKIHSFWEFFNRIDAAAKSPYIIRILRTLIYMMYMVHLNACAYYAMSVWEGLGTNDWVYNNRGNAYLRCFYFAIRTATSISGKMPKPNNIYEYIFMTISWLLGVFVFAFLIGQIRDIVATATQNKTLYRQIMDQSIRYMHNLCLPDDLQQRVRLWLNHTWEQQKTFDENKILNLLPSKMKTDLALSVHYQMLNKVQLFQDCERTVLRDLVVKLRPVLFLPGDFVCRKGEVGTEMYIVNKGQVCVTGGPDGSIILATLSEGSVFGEVSVLGIPGCSRRTADVRSLGFANLFVLSKADLWDTLRNYPEAQSILRHKARKVMKEREGQDKPNEEDIDAESIIKDPERRPSTPRMVKTVMQMVSPQSKCGRYLARSRSSSLNRSSLTLTPSVYSATPSGLTSLGSSYAGSYAGLSVFSETTLPGQPLTSESSTSREQSRPISEDVEDEELVNPHLIDDIVSSSV